MGNGSSQLHPAEGRKGNSEARQSSLAESVSFRTAVPTNDGFYPTETSTERTIGTNAAGE